MFKEKITRALDYLGIGYTTQNRANASSQYLKLPMLVENLTCTLGATYDLVIDIVSLDEEEILNDIGKLMKVAFAPYRDLSKANKNYKKEN